MVIDLQHCCLLLGTADNIHILCHKSPDGDTIGAAYGLYYALSGIGKRVAVKCSDELPQKFSYIYSQAKMADFTPDFVVSVDVADEGLFGKCAEEYANKVDLCIDHHRSNSGYAKSTLVDATAAATCELIYTITNSMGIAMNLQIASALYTGIATDTGCFRYANTTAETLRIAAKLIEAGVDNGTINYNLFELKTRTRTALERIVMDSLEYSFDDRCAVIDISRKMLDDLGASMEDVDGISSIPRTIEGVQLAITFRENIEGNYKVSMRSSRDVDVSKICAAMGGGGHAAAAGCNVNGPLSAAKAEVLAAVKIALEV